jgi:CubicO group peptidase (beta-lactamase class C family)
MSSTRLQRVSAWLEAQVEDERLAGCSVLVGRRGKLAFAETAGLADQSLQRTFELDTVARI